MGISEGSDDVTAGTRRFAATVAAIIAMAERGGGLTLLADDDGWGDAVERVDRLRDPQFVIGLCGEFSSGKSVLLGALMRRPELFPEGVGATTAVPTLVRWGRAERILVRTLEVPDGFLIGPAELADHVTEQGNPHNERNVLEVLVELPSPLLADGICLVDLPGTGSTYAPHALVANVYLERIDAALFVTPSAAMKDSEVDFLRRVAARVGDALVIVLSKADLISAQYGADGLETTVGDLRQKAADALGLVPENLVIIPVSALGHQLALGDPEEEQASGIPALTAAIETSISARAGSLLVGDALQLLAGALDDALLHGQERLTALIEGRTPEIRDVQDQLAARKAWLSDVADREQEWTERLRERLEQIGRNTHHRLNGTLHTIRTDALAVLQRSDEPLDANAFTSRVINKVHDTYVESASALEGQVNDALTELAADLGLSLERVRADLTFQGTAASAFVEPVPARQVTGTTRRYGEAANRAARKSSGWRALGIGLGVVVGVVVTVATAGAGAGLIALAGGAVLGGAAGAAVGTASATAAYMGRELAELDQVDPETRRQRLRQHVVDGLTPNQTEATGRMSTVTASLLTSAVSLLKRVLARERKLTGARIDRLDQDLARTKAQAVVEADLLRPQLAEVEDALIPEAARLRAEVAAEVQSLAAWRSADGSGGPAA